MRPLLLTLLLASLPFLFGIWVNETAPHPPTAHYVAARCTRYCYAHACPHATAGNSPAYVRLRPLRWHHRSALGGRWGAVWRGECGFLLSFYTPAAAVAHIWGAAQRLDTAADKATAGMSALLHLADQVVHFAFWYCVDFMVNLANLTHSSYPEANTWVLLLLLPGLMAALLGVRVAQWFQLRRGRRQ